VSVMVSDPGKGLSADQIADMLMNKIVFVGPNVPAPIREQAHAFKDHVRQIANHYVKMAQKSERTTVLGALEGAGMTDAANLIRSL
jgi:hypothetical protein